MSDRAALALKIVFIAAVAALAGLADYYGQTAVYGRQLLSVMGMNVGLK